MISLKLKMLPQQQQQQEEQQQLKNTTQSEDTVNAKKRLLPRTFHKKTKVKRMSRRSGNLSAWEIQYKLALKHGLSTCAGRKAARAALRALGVMLLPAKGKECNLEEALDQILKFPYNSQERGAVTKLLCEGGYVGIKQTQLYKCINRAEKKLKNQTTMQTRTTNDTSSLGLWYEGDYTRWGI
jgi:hypothetical protein